MRRDLKSLDGTALENNNVLNLILIALFHKSEIEWKEEGDLKMQLESFARQAKQAYKSSVQKKTQNIIISLLLVFLSIYIAEQIFF